MQTSIFTPVMQTEHP